MSENDELKMTLIEMRGRLNGYLDGVAAIRADIDKMIDSIDSGTNGGTPRALSVREAAHQLGIGINKTWGLVHDGTLASVQVGNRYIISETAIKDLLDNQQGPHRTKKTA